MNKGRIIVGDARPAFPARTERLLAQRHTLVDPDGVLRAARKYLAWTPHSVQHIPDGKGSCIHIVTGDDHLGLYGVTDYLIFLGAYDAIHDVEDGLE